MPTKQRLRTKKNFKKWKILEIRIESWKNVEEAKEENMYLNIYVCVCAHVCTCMCIYICI